MTKDKNSVELHAVVDRLEDGDQAVLRLGDTESISVDFPLSLLPEGTTGGDHLRLRITRDEASRDAATERTSALLERLESRTTPQGKKDFKL